MYETDYFMFVLWLNNIVTLDINVLHYNFTIGLLFDVVWTEYYYNTFIINKILKVVT